MAKIDNLLQRYRSDLALHQKEATRLRNAFEERVRAAEIIEAKIAGIEEALQLVDENLKRPPSGSRKQRQVSGVWKTIMEDVARNAPVLFGYDELEAAAEKAGVRVANRDNLRSQMSLYKDRGIVESVESGTFRINTAGAAAAGINVENVEASDAQTSEASESLGPLGGERGYPPSAPEGSNPSGSTQSRPRPNFDVDLDDDVPF